MALSVQSLGHNESTGTISTLALTALANILAGDLVLVAVAHGANTTAFSSVTDGTNTYVRRTGGSLSGGNGRLELWECPNAAAVSSPTITVNGSSALDWMIAALRCAGATSAPIDTSPAAAIATTNSPTASTGAFAQEEEIVVGLMLANNNPTATTAAGFTDIANVRLGDANKTYNFAYDLVSSAASQTFNPGLSGSQTTVTIVASYKATPKAGWINTTDPLPPRKARQQTDVTFVSPSGLIPVAATSGIPWSERFEEFKGRPKFTDPPAYGIPPVPAVGISGVAFSQPLDYATPRKGRTDPQAFDPRIMPAVGISGTAWSLRLDYAFPKKGRTEPPAFDPKVTPAVGVQGVSWSERFEPFYGRKAQTQPPAFGIPPVPAVGVQGVAWSQRFEPFYGKPIGLSMPPVWVVAPEVVRFYPPIRPAGAIPKWRFLG